MISVLFDGFVWIARKPVLLLPCFFSTALLLALLLLADPAIQGFAFGLVLENSFPSSSVFDFPFLFYSMHSGEINIVLALLFVFGVVGNLLAFCLARFAKEKKSVVSAIGFAMANLGNAFFLTLLEALVAGFFFAAALLVLWLFAVNELLGIAAGIVFALAALLVCLVFLFLPAALAASEATIKEALKESSGFVKKRVFSVLVFVAILVFLFFLISGLGAGLASLVPDDALFFVVDFAFLLVATAYAGIVVPLYYVSSREKNASA